jgi:hypothetical protein
MPVAQPTAFPVTRLPYLGERRGLKFDRLQWPARSKGSFAPILKRANLAFSDYQRSMHQIRYATANDIRMQYTPAFAHDDKLVRLVLAQQCYLYALATLSGRTKTADARRIPGTYLNNKGALDDLMSRAEAAQRTFDFSANPLAWRAHQSHLRAIDRHGSYLNVRALVQHRAWRLYQNGHEIGNEMGIAWHDVRQILQRLVIVATRLGLETYPKHHSFRHEIRADLARQEPQIAA